MRPLFQILVLSVLVWTFYWNSLSGPFAFDDWHVIPSNPAIKNLENIPSFFVDTSHFSILVGNRDYRPLFLSSMAINWWMGGGQTWPFHLVSVFLHMGNVLLVFLILRVFLAQQKKSPVSSASTQAQWVPFLSSALFALHPLATESVNYVSSQSVPLASFFYLFGFYFFLLVYFRDRPPSKLKKGLALVGSYLSYFLALLAKPIGISLPLILLMWDVIYGWPKNSRNIVLWKQLSQRILKHLPYWGISLVYLYIRHLVSPSPFAVGESVRPRLTHYLTETKAMVMYYLKLAVLPLGQNVDREFPLSTSIMDWQVMLSLGVLLGISYLLFRHRHNKYLVFWSLWFPACLLVTSYLVILIQVVNEHRVYLSLIGFCAVLGSFLVWLCQAFPLHVAGRSIGSQWGNRVAVSLVCIILLSLGYGTIERNKVWSSDFSLWEDAAFKSGTWRAHMNYALALEAKGRKDEALAQFQVAVKLGPYSYAHMNLGLAYVKRGEQDKGIEHLRTAVRLWPTSPEAHLFLGWGLKRGGSSIEAEKEYRKALELRPNYVKAYRYLADLYEKQGREDEAVAMLVQLRALDPTNTSVEKRMDRLTHRLFIEAFDYQKKGERQQAIDRYQKLLRIAPDHRQGNFNLGFAYLGGSTKDDWYRSITLFQNVLKIDPSYTETLFRLASAYWKLEIEGEAIRYDRWYLKDGNHPELRATSQKRLEEAEERKSARK